MLLVESEITHFFFFGHFRSLSTDMLKVDVVARQNYRALAWVLLSSNEGEYSEISLDFMKAYSKWGISLDSFIFIGLFMRRIS